VIAAAGTSGSGSIGGGRQRTGSIGGLAIASYSSLPASLSTPCRIS
jgi:hypothetical protein